MNLSVKDISERRVVVSQFLQALTKKAIIHLILNIKPEIAVPLYEQFVASRMGTRS
jgi:D-Tyr-tRNAtyr deacylase